MERKCSYCGKIFQRRKGQFRKDAKHFFCSVKCRNEFQKCLKNINCLFCKKEFHPSNKWRKFCSLICYWKYLSKNKPKNGFKKGNIPWNKNTKGIMKVNSGSFKKGRKSEKWKPIKIITQRKDKSGTIRNWIKIKEPNTWIEYAKYLWLKAGKKLVKGFCLHHINLDSSDDRLENLCLVSRKDHPKIHNRWNTKNIFTEKRIKKISQSFL